MSEAIVDKRSAWLDKPLSSALRLDWERALYLTLFVLAVLSRFWDLGARAMSHDESLHAWYSWELFRGVGYTHTPLSHGPFLFHLNALVYTLFGADDFTARIAPAVFGVALVMSPYLLRRWLGRRGALVTAFLLLISPSILYHARYIRNDEYMLLFGVLMLWAMLSYVGERKTKWLFLLAALAILMYVTKENAFMYVAIFGFFAVAFAVAETAREAGWGRNGVGGALLGIGLAIGMLAVGILIGARVLEFFRPVPPVEGGAVPVGQLLPSLLAIAVFGAAIGVGVIYLLRRFMPAAARQSAGLDIAVILGGLSLFMLSASALLVLNYHFGVAYQDVAGVPQAIPDSGTTVWGAISGAGNQPYVDAQFFADGNFPTDPANTFNVVRMVFLFACFSALAFGLGMWWDAFKWLISVGIFGGVGVVLFTTVFTNGVGMGTGFVGSLGYWLAQQEVNRGTQPPGYYFFITPFYEYLPMILALAALIYFGWRMLTGQATTLHESETGLSQRSFVPLLMAWTVLSWTVYTAAGEKMPWLMVHLALPMIFLGGRLVGEWLDRIDWHGVLAGRTWLAGLLFPILLLALQNTIRSLSDLSAAAQQDTAAPSLTQLTALGGLLSGLLFLGGALAVLAVLLRRSGLRPALHMAALSATVILALLTMHTAWDFSYVNYDYPIEYGVYAHGGPGLKIALDQIRELSERVTGTPNQMEVLYDDGATWPWQWYLRNFPNKRFIAGAPSRSDASLPVMLLSSDNWGGVDQSVGNNYTWSQYHRIWWPMEDYKRMSDILCPREVRRSDGNLVRYAAFDENGDNVIDATEQAAGDARCRGYQLQLIPAVWDIFLHRDYTRYASLTGQTMTLQNWPLQEDFRLYVRRDLAAKAWDQAIGDVAIGSTGDVPGPSASDPYQAHWRQTSAIQMIGSAGSESGQFSSPHGIALAPDGAIYVADSGNHRIIKFDATGQYLLSFGTWSGEPPNNDLLNPQWNPPPGTFYEPWDVAVASDGSVYVADLWNSRVQKFDADGNFLTLWGGFGDSGHQAVGAEGRFFGPRGIAVSPDNRVYVADTGNKRVQVFDGDGKFITQFGGGGLLDGNLDEPVGIAVNSRGEVVVADTWNGRVQVFGADGQALRKWDVYGWLDFNAEDLGRSKVGKPYLGVGPDDRIYVSDQVANRILVFDAEGNYQAAFGQFDSDARGFSAPSGIAINDADEVLIVDTGNGRVMVFPPVTEEGDVEQ